MLKEKASLSSPSHIPGMDAAGVVGEVGDGATGTAVGDAVFGPVPPARLGGASAEYAVLEAWARKPRAWSFGAAVGAAGNVETATRVLGALGPPRA